MKKPTPYNYLKIFAHPEKIKAISEGKQTSPIYIRIKPTNVCNHACYYCSYADSALGLRDNVVKSDYIEWDKMRQIIDDMKDIGVKSVTLSGGGEPLAYKYILETLDLLNNTEIETSVITNGQLLCGKIAEALKNAKWVRISMDSCNRETYAKIRNISLESFDKICENILNFSKIKNKNCELGINFVVNHENYMQIYDMARLAKSLSANHIKFAARITKNLIEYHEPFKNEAISQIRRAIKDLEGEGFRIINVYEDDFAHEMSSVRDYNRCPIKEIFTVIAADSRVYFCHDKAYVSDGVVGDLKNSSFKELWFSEETRKRFDSFDPHEECKHHCVYDSRNILLNTFLELDKNHINFI